MNSHSTASYAENYHLILSKQELTWICCEPNENINKAIEILRNKYKVEVSSMEYAGLNSYVAGDPTPAMSWFLSIEKNRQNKLTGMEYGRFKESEGGLRVETSRGIKYGSGIASVYNSYGTNPTIIRTRHPMMNYVDLKYAFELRETGQKGNLIFTLHYKLGDSEKNATVIRLKWILI
jgi:hypothetical protein